MAAMRVPAAPRPAAEPREPERRSRLVPVKAHELSRRLQRRRARFIATVAGCVVVGALLVVTGAQALVASQQVRLDNLQVQLQGATVSNDNLQLQRAELSAPGTVLAIVEHRLHMVVPATVVYLTPINPGPSVAEVSSGSSR